MKESFKVDFGVFLIDGTASWKLVVKFFRGLYGWGIWKKWYVPKAIELVAFAFNDKLAIIDGFTLNFMNNYVQFL